MNRTSITTRTENRELRPNRAPRDHYQEVTDRIIAALEEGTPPWRRPWDPDKAGGPAMPRNASTSGVSALTPRRRMLVTPVAHTSETELVPRSKP